MNTYETIINDVLIQKQNEIINRELMLAYAGGLIDGEGCIGIYGNSHNGNYQLRISVEMVHNNGLKILNQLFGGRWYNQKAKAPRRARYKWMLFNSKAEKALKQLIPYLLVKHNHAQIALEANWSQFIGGKKLTSEEIKIRHSVYSRIKKLNKRGYYPEEGEKLYE